MQIMKVKESALASGAPHVAINRIIVRNHGWLYFILDRAFGGGDHDDPLLHCRSVMSGADKQSSNPQSLRIGWHVSELEVFVSDETNQPQPNIVSPDEEQPNEQR